MATVFVCEFPPPYGGVTVKNKLLIDKIVRQSDEYIVIDLCRIKRNIFNIFSVGFQMFLAFLRKDTIVYGLGTHKRLKKALFLQLLLGGKESISKTVIVVMGGLFHAHVMNDEKLKKLVIEAKCNLVETEGMKKSLDKIGFNNVVVFPNPKPENTRFNYNSEGKLKCVFFSKICKNKGVDYIISELGGLKEEKLSIDFYGPIDTDIKDEFEKFIQNFDYANYRGIFDSSKDDVYSELSKYDVLLFPTRYKTEGVPGILVEAKMAGVATIVSNYSYNSEIVQDGVEGIVLANLDKGTMLREIMTLQNDRKRIEELKKGAFESRSKYCLEKYISELRWLFGLEI